MAGANPPLWYMYGVGDLKTYESNDADDRNELSENGFEIVGHRSAPARSSSRSSCDGLMCRCAMVKIAIVLDY